MTWNVHGVARPDTVALADVIASARPDVVALQEVRRGQTRDIARHLGWNRVWARKHTPGSPLLPHLDEGLAIISPHPIGAVAHTVISRGEPLWSWRRRIAVAATVRRGAAHLRLVDVHLAAHDAVDARIDQARRLVRSPRLVDAPHGTPLVVAGDLNTHDEPEVIREFHPLGLVDPGGHATCPAHAPQQRLDRVLVPHQATVSDEVFQGWDARHDIDWATLSDHLPLVVDIHL